MQSNSIDWEMIEAASFPTFFTAYFSYFATGEGMTNGITLGHALSVEDIREAINSSFGAFYRLDAQVFLDVDVRREYEDLIPRAVQHTIAELRSGAIFCNFS